MKSKKLYLLLAVAAMGAFHQKAQAQTDEVIFTITNGTVQWIDREGGTAQPLGYREDVLVLGSLNAATTTYRVQKGTLYMALDPSTPKLITTNTFSERCMWKRTDNPGFYYQEIDGWDYYITGSITGPSVWKVQHGSPIESATYWVHSEAGGYMDKTFIRDGEKHVVKYWLMPSGNEWVMSCESDHRPETRNYNPSGNDYVWYCTNSSGSGEAGKAVTLLPVKIIEHAAHIPNEAQNVGLIGISLKDASNNVVTQMRFGDELTADPIYSASANPPGTNYEYTQPYREVREYTKLEGLAFNPSNDGTETYGNAGVPTYTSHYYYHDDNYTARHTTPPSPVSTNFSTNDINSVEYSLDAASSRYLEVTKIGDNKGKITVKMAPVNDIIATLTVTVGTTYGISENYTSTIVLKGGMEHNVISESVNSVFINGDVFGGGRMADVEGSTDVLVVNCDTISRVYGGNDIAGSVANGATVTIGNTSTTNIGINSVYGAGNGFYFYEGVSTPHVGFTTCNTALAAGTNVHPWNDPSGSDLVGTTVEASNVPFINKTVITVNSANVRIDTVFGGARNADVLPTGRTYDEGAGETLLTSVTINDGIVFAIFGGNNVGGCLNLKEPASYTNASDPNLVALKADHWRTDITINNTPVQLTGHPILNSFYNNYGRQFGIRYVYGGGNKVFSGVRSDVFINGGMIDSVFGGGNEASVFRANVFVQCNGSTIYDNPTAVAGAPDAWVGTRGAYNVRALFGGNNRAPMACVPDVRLVSGGIGVVYGGGNAGDMVNEDLNLVSDASYASWHRTAIQNAKNEFHESVNKIDAPEAALSTFIHAQSPDIKVDYIYGGCRSANVNHSTLVHIEGGEIGTVFGGCNISGNVGLAQTVAPSGRARGGTYVVIDEGAHIYANVFAGSNGYYHCVNDESSAAASYTNALQFEDNAGTPFDMYDDYIGMLRPTHNYTHVALMGGTIEGNLYGGGNHATVGFKNNTYGYPTADGIASGPATANHGGIHISLLNGTVKGNVYGGCNMASVYGLSYFYIGGTVNVLGDVYGGNDRLGNVGSDVAMPFTTVDGTELVASDGTPLNSGGKANYSLYILVEDNPQIGRLFAGGNGAYNYSGENPQYPTFQAYCGNYTRSEAPEQNSALVDIHVKNDARIDTVFGGGNAVSMSSHTVVLVNTEDDPDISKEVVGTIFGGNNMANMNIVPEVRLTRGVVGTIYGGGNMGHMKGFTNSIMDICGIAVPDVSAYVLLNSTDATVLGAVYGGCNKADVEGLAYVHIKETSNHGVDTVYGGNDVSGIIRGDTRVDISGGHVGTIYGGSNGYYDYEQYGQNNYRVHKFNHGANDGTILYENSIGSPFVDETQVNIYGGTVNNNIYGGGRMGDCRLTNVYINDNVCPEAGNSTIIGLVYGGGEGDTSRLDLEHRGNVTEATNVNLHHASHVIAIAYGGGKGGDVHNANITSHNTWDESFDKIFGGGWGADVTGVARLTMDANMPYLMDVNNRDKYTANRVHGGNDFTGSVYRSEVTLNGGRYIDIYGAGCGNFPESNYKARPSSRRKGYTADPGTYTQTRDLFVPNNEEVVITINGWNGFDTTVWVDGTVYGGGHMGTTMRYLKDEDGAYILSPGGTKYEAGSKIPDTNFTAAYLGTAATGLSTNYTHDPYTDPNDYAYIIVNVHGGVYATDIFAGAQGNGDPGKNNQLVYGLKVLNMDGGHVKQSVYGGSQSVSDGYSRNECNINGSGQAIIDVTTTMRPSSILNLTGGRISNHVYGAGYKGFTYGSVYVNVGTHAVDSSSVWRTSYGPAGNRVAYAYAKFKPGLTTGLSDALVTRKLALEASVYAGANWGQNDGSFTFDGEGFFGGESRILVDGKNYTGENVINIANSILGAGTSVLGGDMLSRIDIRNYGSIDNCHATKRLKAIQRADALFLHNTAIKYEGVPDASSAFHSPNYAINDVDTVNTVGFNLVEIDAPKAKLKMLRFFEDETDFTKYDYKNYVQGNASLSVLTPATVAQLESGDGVCGDDKKDCDKINRIHPVSHKYAAILMNNGVTIDVTDEINSDGEIVSFGGITGYAYLVSQDDTRSVVRARLKQNINPNDGGFSCVCADSNSADGMRFRTYTYSAPNYRYWSPGEILSTREAVLLAHSEPSVLPVDKYIKVTGTTETGAPERNLVLSHTQVTLPPAMEGYYYMLDDDYGVFINDDNDNMTLVDVAWNPTSWDAPKNDEWVTAEDQGAWFIPTAKSPSTSANFTYENAIDNDPNTTFGLLLASGSGFNTHSSVSVISPSTHIDNTVYVSDLVKTNDVSPVLDLYLTYSNDFTNSILGSVKFRLKEFDNEGVPTGNIIEIEAYVSTIINEFKDMEFDLVAESNDGDFNEFLKRGILPATLKQRSLYIESVKWYPTEPDPERSVPYTNENPGAFKLASDRSKGGYILTDAPDINRYRFAVNVMPVENTDGSSTSDIGWYSITNSSTDIYSLVYDNNTGVPTNDQSIVLSSYTASNTLEGSEVAFSDLTQGGTTKGREVGILDGRGLAGLNFELFYDGRFKTEWHSYFVGDIVLGMASYETANPSAPKNPFKITLHVMVRPGSDTIFVGSTSNLADGAGGTHRYSDRSSASESEIGMRPKYWVKTFAEAMAESRYKPGSIICVVDSVIITDEVNIIGTSEYPVKIIRYEGHHTDKPNENGVYRGPMIVVKNGGKLNLENVVLNGSATGMLTKNTSANWGVPGVGTYTGSTYEHADQLIARTSTRHMIADTNVAFGPVIAVDRRGVVHFRDNVVVEENWNSSRDPYRSGAISVVNGGVLQLQDNVTIRNNFACNSQAITHHCDNGAVYVNKGQVVHLKPRSGSSYMTITDNYLLNVTGLTGSKDGAIKTTADSKYWVPISEEIEDQIMLAKWTIDTAKNAFEDAQKANVFLTLDPSLTSDDGYFEDNQSDAIPLAINAPFASRTRIGVTKWFPGDPNIDGDGDNRDTVRFAYQDDFTEDLPNRILRNGNFISDEGHRIMYNSGIDEQQIYFVRCATFRHQLASDEDLYGEIEMSDPLVYELDPDAKCPNGNDKIYYNVVGGFFPYHYQWRNDEGIFKPVLRSRSTGMTNTELFGEVSDRLEEDPEHAFDPIREALVDTFNVPYVHLDPVGPNSTKTLYYEVSATDATGCVVSKRIKINLAKSKTLAPTMVKNTVPKDYWIDSSSSVYNENVIAEGTRYYPGVQITAVVWPHTDDASPIVARGTYSDMASVTLGNSWDNLLYYNLDEQTFCEGDTINLFAENIVNTDDCEDFRVFAMWDFDPYYSSVSTVSSNYVVPADDATVVAYYAPPRRWVDVVNSPYTANAKYDDNYYFVRSDEGYITTYNDDVHIYDENGLAWLISVINGLNGVQAREFYFNRVYLHKKSDGTPYDMGCFKWTPMGSPQHPFRGWFRGVGSTFDDTTRLAVGDYVVIRNLIVNEPELSNVGFFGYLDTARISGIEFQGAMMRGAHHVGVLSARAKDTRVDNIRISSSATEHELVPHSDDTPVMNISNGVITTLLTTHNISGGVIGYSEHTVVKNNVVSAKFLGDAVYSGGIIGFGVNDTIQNSATRNDARMNGLFLGGLAGSLNGEAPVNGLFRQKSAGRPSYVANNYVHFTSPGCGSRVGGIVGQAANTVMENNYIYGFAEANFSEGGVAAELGQNALASNNYYAADAAKQDFGMVSGNGVAHDNTTFSGSGNAVTLAQRVNGVNNLTRVLNKWVREQNANGGDYLTWSSDLAGLNHGYPRFGTPDMIPVYDSSVVEGCEEVLWAGVLYTDDARVTVNVIDTIEMVDSTMATIIRVHHAANVSLEDSATVGEAYSGHGFYVSATESELLSATLDSAGYATLVLTDTLQTAYGCDSVITLTLTFSATKGITDVKPVAEVKVYPNPTTSTVNVATDDLTHVEVYDNEGRRLQNYDARGRQVATLDLTHYASGIYYIRVHTIHGVTIQKVIKR